MRRPLSFQSLVPLGRLGLLLVLAMILAANSGSITVAAVPFWRRRRYSYSRSLNEQRRLLERQMRQGQDELAQLRRQFQIVKDENVHLTSQAIATRRAEEMRLQDELRVLKQQIVRLEKELSKMEAIQADLEQMLATERTKVEMLQKELREAKQDSDRVRETYEKEMIFLRKEFEVQLAKQLEELKVLMEKRMADALEAARLKAEAERKEAVANAERRVQEKAEQKLSAERTKLEKAVENEKMKMRKLVKALAEREKKLLAQSEELRREKRQQTSASSNDIKPAIPTTLASSTQARKPETVRSPLK